MTTLAKKHCIPCEGTVPSMNPADAKALLAQLQDGWKIIESHHLKRTFKFDNFVDALEFVNKVGDIAEKEQHHPDITVGWGKASVEIWTHAASGLTENDFILAAKIDEVF